MKTTFINHSGGYRSLNISVPVAGKRLLLVVIVIDVSGSMSENGKIQSVQYGMEAALRSIRALLQGKEGIDAQLVVIGYGEHARVLLGPVSVETAELPTLVADEQTTLAAEAIELLNRKVHELIEGRKMLKPVLVLVSDGLAHDKPLWQQKINDLLATEWCGRRAIRVGIGVSGARGDCDLELLRAFMADPGNEPLVAADACELGAFIEFALESSFRQSARIDHHVAQMQFPILPSLPLEDEDDCATRLIS